jgi:hypothetical protein
MLPLHAVVACLLLALAPGCFGVVAENLAADADPAPRSRHCHHAKIWMGLDLGAVVGLGIGALALGVTEGHQPQRIAAVSLGVIVGVATIDLVGGVFMQSKCSPPPPY